MTSNKLLLLAITMVILPACVGEITTGIEVSESEEAQMIVAEDGQLILFDGLSVAVPSEIGAGVGAVAELDDGTWAELLVENNGDGSASVQARRLHLDSHSDTIGKVAQSLTGPDGCSDGAYKTAGDRKWKSSYRWHLNTSNRPTGISSATLETVLKKAMRNVVASKNDCGMSDRVSASQSYRGRTSKGLGITSGGTCKGPNGKNVVGFGKLYGLKAYTCWYWNGQNELYEADVRLKSNNQGWITSSNIPDTCVNELHLESVATHEFGHVFGLLHPSGDHPTLTMQAGGSCDASKASLGRGDVRGLRSLY